MKTLRQIITCLGRTSKPSATCQETHAGCEPAGRFLCLFASFDHFSRVPDYVIRYLKELQRQGCDIVFVSTSPSLPEEALATLRPLCIKIIRRANRGLDFASWRAGFDYCPKDRRYNGVLLANDSVLGPFQPLDKVFKALAASEDELVGLNDSHELGYHLQSFFLYFPMTLFLSRPVQAFWNNIRVLDDKQLIIDRYEIGLSRYLAEHQIPIKAIFPVAKLIQTARQYPDQFEFMSRLEQDLPINPSLHFWDILLKKYDYPFVKRELLTRNPIGSQNVQPFLVELESSTRDIDQLVRFYLANEPV